MYQSLKIKSELASNPIVRLNQSDIAQLLIDYFNGTLKKSDKMDKLPKAKAICYEDNSKGIPLSRILTYTDVHKIVNEMHQETVIVDNRTFNGFWHTYVLKVWIGFEDPLATHNELMPKVTDEQLFRTLYTFVKRIRELF